MPPMPAPSWPTSASPLRTATVGDVQAFGAAIAHQSPATRARKLGSVKSLLSFAHRLGYVAFNVGAPVRLPAIKETLNERIIVEADVHRLLALEADPRNHALLRLLYVAGLRISEACGLRWRDLTPRDDAGQVTVFGKGGKTGIVLLPAPVWREMVALRDGADADAPVFLSGKGAHLSTVQVHRVVKAAAARAGCPPRCRPIGCVMPTGATRSTAAPRSAWCRPRCAMPAWRRRAGICTPGPTTAAPATWLDDVSPLP